MRDKFYWKMLCLFVPSIIKRWALRYTLTTTSVRYLKKHATIRNSNIANVKIN